jgi:nitrite reductase/ring-hydroxylating ferredoxin subunit
MSGGELSFGLGVRVNRTAWEAPPDTFTAVAKVGDVEDERLCRVELGGAPVVLARSSAGALCAIAATCSHFGGPLDEGVRDGDSVICPWHGSRFDLRTGEVIDGPAVFAQPRYEVRERDGAIELRAHDPDTA